MTREELTPAQREALSREAERSPHYFIGRVKVILDRSAQAPATRQAALQALEAIRQALQEWQIAREESGKSEPHAMEADEIHYWQRQFANCVTTEVLE